jgi:hypothetical protein
MVIFHSYVKLPEGRFANGFSENRLALNPLVDHDFPYKKWPF